MQENEFNYPMEIEESENAIVFNFRDIPEAIGCAIPKKNLMKEAKEILKIALGYYIKENQFIPKASQPIDGEKVVTLPESFVQKIIKHNAKIKAKR